MLSCIRTNVIPRFSFQNTAKSVKHEDVPLSSYDIDTILNA